MQEVKTLGRGSRTQYLVTFQDYLNMRDCFVAIRILGVIRTYVHTYTLEASLFQVLALVNERHC